MRVLLINTGFYYSGSTGKIVKSLADAMTSEKIETEVLYGINRGETDCSYSHLIAPRNYKRINELKSRILGNHGFNNAISTKKAIGLIEEFKPDIVHLHNLHGSYINLKMLFMYLTEKKIRIIWTLHDAWSFTGRCAYYDYNGCQKWMEGCGNCKYKSQYPVSWLIDSSKKNYQTKKELYSAASNLTLVTPSNWLKEELKKSFLKQVNAIVINNGINLDEFKPIASDIKDKNKITTKIMLAVAYFWDERKGINYLPMIADQLSEEWNLVVIGEMRGYKNILKKAGIRVISRLYDDSELAKWYSAADVFINPTLEDNFPTVNIEALACGTPCVTFDTGGSPEILDSETGIVVRKRDWKEMLHAAEGIDKAALSEKCVQRARDYYDEKRFVNDYLSLYHQTMKNKI